MACLMLMVSCGSGEKDAPNISVVSNLVPNESSTELIGTNCRAETLSEIKGERRYKSTYLGIMSDGSEVVQNVVETETPCP